MLVAVLVKEPGEATPIIALPLKAAGRARRGWGDVLPACQSPQAEVMFNSRRGR